MNFITVDPRLSEFSEEELSDTRDAIQDKLSDLRTHVAGLKKESNVAWMMAFEILEYEVKIDNLETFLTQTLNAIARKKEQIRIESN